LHSTPFVQFLSFLIMGIGRQIMHG
jgi:hypothetical protein